jgi:hypothetical protein
VARAREARKGGEQKWRRQGATRGREIQQEVVLGKLCRRWAVATGAEQKGEAAGSEEDEAGRCQGIYLQFSKSSGTLL